MVYLSFSKKLIKLNNATGSKRSASLTCNPGSCSSTNIKVGTSNLYHSHPYSYLTIPLPDCVTKEVNNIDIFIHFLWFLRFLYLLDILILYLKYTVGLTSAKLSFSQTRAYSKITGKPSQK
jgi:hypothetical protein